MSGVDLRCAVRTRAIGVSVIGTAPQETAIAVVGLALPWPSEIRDLVEVAPRPGRRVLAAVPDGHQGAGDAVEWVRSPGSDRFRPKALAAGTVATSMPPASRPHWLLCGHGSRDRCCGSLGTSLAVRTASSGTRRVQRVSHLGGHRFAPTGISFPDGRAWANLDEVLLDAIDARSVPPSTLMRNYRGRVGVDSWVQPLEAAMFAHHGWDWDRAALGSAVEHVDGSSAQVTLHWTLDGHSMRAEGYVRRFDGPVRVTCGVADVDPTSREVVYELLAHRWR